MIHQPKVATPSDHHHHLRRPLRSNRLLMSAKGCEEYGDCRRRKFYRRLFGCVLAFIVLVLFVILVIFLVLRPSKPKFYIQDATVYQLNLSGDAPPAGLLTTTMQVTVSSRNPNDRIGIYYDKLDVFVSYKNQQITLPSALPRGYQGHNDVTVWSPYLYGAAVPVAPYVAALLGQDQNAGYVLLYVKLQGRLRWKVGSWISGRYHIDVSCPAFLNICGGGGGGCGSPSAYHFQHISSCSVDV